MTAFHIKGSLKCRIKAIPGLLVSGPERVVLVVLLGEVDESTSQSINRRIH